MAEAFNNRLPIEKTIASDPFLRHRDPAECGMKYALQWSYVRSSRLPESRVSEDNVALENVGSAGESLNA